MSSGSIRIIQLPEKSSVNTDDYMAVDSSANGTKKIKFTDLLDNNLSVQNKAADAQATGEAINNVNARVDNMINTQQNESVTTLWTGSIDKKNQTASLSESIANFDFVDIYIGDVDTVFARKPVSSSVHFEIQTQNMSDNASVQFLRWYETGLTISGTTATIDKAIRCYWDDFSQHPVVAQAGSDGGANIIRIDGVKIGHVENDEIVDARVGANGTTYPTLGDAIRGQVTDLKAELKATVDGLEITASGKTPIYLNAGEKIIIDVSAIDGNVNAYIDGYTSTNVLLIKTTGHFEYTAQNSGYLRFYFLTATAMTAKIQPYSDLYDVEQNVNALTEEAFREGSLNLELGSIDTGHGTNTSSSSALRTVEYINESIIKIAFQNCKVRLFAYKQDGTFVGGYSVNDDYTKDWSKYKRFTSPVYMDDFSGNNYRFRLVFDQFSGSVTPENANVNVEISIIDELVKKSEEVYRVGVNKDFSTFTEMLIVLKDNVNKKVVYVDGGTYDIFEEMGGAEYMATVDTSANWRDVSHVVPPNTTIIGLGDVVLSWNPTDAQIIDQSHAFLFSPLNLSGTCKIVNIKVECSNCRYGIHDETSGISGFNGAVHEFENVSVIYLPSTYGVHYAYGAGHNKNMKLRFKNCLFSAAYGAVWSTHDWPASASEGSVFEIDNCVFLDNRTSVPAAIRFSSSDTAGRLDDVKINGCVFSEIQFSTEGSSAIKQGYKVQTMLCKTFTVSYSSYIASADRITPVEYLTIS